MTITHESFSSLTADSSEGDARPFAQLEVAVQIQDPEAIEAAAETLLDRIDAVKEDITTRHNRTQTEESPRTVIGRTLGIHTLLVVERAWELNPTPATEGLVDELIDAYPVPDTRSVHRSAFATARIKQLTLNEALDIAADAAKKRVATTLQRSDNRSHPLAS